MKIPFAIRSEKDILPVFEKTFDTVQKKHATVFFSPRTRSDLRQAFVEGVTNAIVHAGEIVKKGKVTGQLFLQGKSLGFMVFDHGRGFSLKKLPLPDFSGVAGSGRGLFMMKQVSDEVDYERGKAHNVLSCKRFLPGYEEKTKGMDLLYELSEAIVRNASVEEVYDIILEQALSLFHVERASILIYDEKLKMLVVAASRGIPSAVRRKTKIKPGDGVSGYVFQHARPLLIEDIEDNGRGLKKRGQYKTRSFISAPMIASPLRLGERPIGVINLTDRIDGKRFGKRDLKLLSTIANQAMACVHVKNLIADVKATEGLKQELLQMRKIQSSYLPKSAPEIDGYSVAGRCEMAQSVGGDYFDFFYATPFLTVVVADVSGHDMSSALTMVNFRAQLKAQLQLSDDVGAILTRLNASLCDDLQKASQFVSCLLVRLNTASGEFALANAGHYPPLFHRGGATIQNSEMVMGIEKNPVYETAHGVLPHGDEMVLFTDGVVESRDEEGQMFGLGNLQKVIRANFIDDALRRVHEIIADVLKFRSDHQMLDDITVVAIARHILPLPLE